MNKSLHYTTTTSEDDNTSKPKKYNIIGCNNCHRSDVTLVKATDSYYCEGCFIKLHKQKFQKKRGR